MEMEEGCTFVPKGVKTNALTCEAKQKTTTGSTLKTNYKTGKEERNHAEELLRVRQNLWGDNRGY